MTDFEGYFGNHHNDLQVRIASYDYLRTFVADHHDWSGGNVLISDVLVDKFHKEISKMSTEDFAFLLCNTGYIPEEYAHDSSQETIYTKLVEVVVCEWAIRMGFNLSVLPKQKASYEDVTIQDKDNVIVCDAKSFRLGRSQKAPNVKDALKEGDIAKWLKKFDGTSLNQLGGLVTFPSQHDWSKGSDFYLYLTNKTLPIVCLFYEQMTFMLVHNISAQPLIDLYKDYGTHFPKQLSKKEGNRSVYWSKIFEVIFDGANTEWAKFRLVSQSIIRERSYHTIKCVEKHLLDLRQEINDDLDSNLTAVELRELLLDAQAERVSYMIKRQLDCIRRFRDCSDGYLDS